MLIYSTCLPRPYDNLVFPLFLLFDSVKLNYPQHIESLHLILFAAAHLEPYLHLPLKTHTFTTGRVTKMSAPVSHGRGGQGNVYPDDTKYTDGEVVREGEAGTGVSTGRGGTWFFSFLIYQGHGQVDMGWGIRPLSLVSPVESPNPTGSTRKLESHPGSVSTGHVRKGLRSGARVFKPSSLGP